MSKDKSLFGNVGIKSKKAPVFKKGGELSAVEKEAKRIDEPEEGEKKTDNTRGKFIGKMFKMRDIAHLLHLKSESYAEHVALNEFYDGLIDFIDAIAEMYQSEGLLDIRIPASVVDTTPIDYISTFNKEVKEYRDNCGRKDAVAVLDEVEGLCNTTLYKLKFLK